MRMSWERNPAVWNPGLTTRSPTSEAVIIPIDAAWLGWRPLCVWEVEHGGRDSRLPRAGPLRPAQGLGILSPQPPLLEQSFCLNEVKFIFLLLYHGCAVHTHFGSCWPTIHRLENLGVGLASLGPSPLDSSGFVREVQEEGA